MNPRSILALAGALILCGVLTAMVLRTGRNAITAINVDESENAAAEHDSPELIGRWVPITTESDGVTSVRFDRHGSVIFEGGDAEGEHQFMVESRKEPKRIDLILLPEHEAVIMKGIYEIKGDQLRLCFGEHGHLRPQAFPSAHGGEASPHVLEFRRAEP